MYCSSALWSEAYDIPQRPDFPSKVDGWDIFFHKASDKEPRGCCRWEGQIEIRGVLGLRVDACGLR